MNISSSVVIAATPERVWSAITDPSRWTTMIPAIKKVEPLTDQPFGVGFRWRETRVMFGREATETMEIAQSTRLKSYVATAGSHGCNYVTTITLTPVSGGTQLSFDFRGDATTFVAKVMSAIMAPFMGGLMRKCLNADLAGIKSAIESTK